MRAQWLFASVVEIVIRVRVRERVMDELLINAPTPFLFLFFLLFLLLLLIYLLFLVVILLISSLCLFVCINFYRPTNEY
jgi:hypothetical protein